MKLRIKSIYSDDKKNLANWDPVDPKDIEEFIVVEIYGAKKNETHEFTIRVATPVGLSRLAAANGVIADRPLLVMESFDYYSLVGWIESTVNSCESDGWMSSVAQLKRYFDSEYDDWREVP